MFMSSPFEKGCNAASENSSPNHSNLNSSSHNRFPVGIQSIGDDSQNVRIQLAVHKYNNAVGSPSNNRRILNSPMRQAFFKQPFKARDYDGEGDHRQGPTKIDKRFENQYEGVGNFPTVHLKKSSVLYRPIRRIKEVKVPYPELPVNRFVTHLPEFSTDHNSPRSVLDVLQDMSRKRVHSKVETDYSRHGSKGLGGDLPVSEEALCRPLFVPKLKMNTVLTRDSTTQTFSPPHSDTSSIASSHSSAKQDTNDPRAELRRKLAKQNNEIFASLSSSLTSKFALKRKIDKITVTKESKTRSDLSSSVKKAKFEDNHLPSGSGKINSGKVVNGDQTNLNDSGTGIKGGTSGKVVRNGKLSESNATSPNKDRLTTIYLDMENSTSPKAQMFQNCIPEIKSSENLKGSSGSKCQYSSNEIHLKYATSSSKAGISSSSENDSSKVETTGAILPISSDSQATDVTTGISEKFKQTDSVSGTLNFNGPNSGSSPQNLFTGACNSANTTQSASNSKIAIDVSKATAVSTVSEFNEPFGVPKSSTATIANSANSTPVSKSAPVDEVKKIEPAVNSTGFAIPAVTTSQLTSGFSNGNGSIMSTNLSTTFSPVDSNLNNASSPSSSHSSLPLSSSMNKPFFSFGQTNNSPTAVVTSSPNTQSSDTQQGSVESILTSKPEGCKNKASWKIPSSSATFPTICCTATTITLGTPTFTFGQKSSGGEAQIKEEKSFLDTGQFKSSGFMIGSDKTGSDEPSKSVFPVFSAPSSLTLTSQSNTQASFNNRSNSLSFTSTMSNPTAQEEKNQFVISSTDKKSSPNLSNAETKTSDSITNQPTVTFTFGQTSNSVNKSVGPLPSTNSSDQSVQPKLFSFGAPPPLQSSFSTGGFGSGTNTSSASLTFGTNTTVVSSFGQSVAKSDAAPTAIFGQNASKSPATSQNTQYSFGLSNSDSAPKVTTAFDAKPGIFGSVSTSSILGRASSTNSPTGTSFTASTTSSLTAFGASTTQTTSPFGGSGFQTNSGFGIPATTQSTITFGTPTTSIAPICFGGTSSGFSSVTTTASIGASKTFGVPSTTQSGFNVTSTSSQIPPFGQSFGQNKSTPTTLGSTSTNIFNSSPSTSSFTPVTNTNFTASEGQNIFGTKSSTGQEGIFGQEVKSPTTTFGGSSGSGFGVQTKFTFGSSSSGTTNSFQGSPPKTTASSVFTFGANTNIPSSGFSFGNTGSTTSSSATSTPFNFSGQSNTTFKFGSSTAKEGSGFGTSSSSSTFTFGAQQNNNNNSNNNANILESKPSTSGMFSFGSAQPQSSTGATFNFGSHPSTSVFNFGSSSSGSKNATFTFGTPQPGSPFGQATPSSGFSAPGTFSIGSGSSSSQSRPRASSRLRRRP